MKWVPEGEESYIFLMGNYNTTILICNRIASMYYLLLLLLNERAGRVADWISITTYKSKFAVPVLFR